MHAGTLHHSVDAQGGFLLVISVIHILTNLFSLGCPYRSTQFFTVVAMPMYSAFCGVFAVGNQQQTSGQQLTAFSNGLLVLHCCTYMDLF